MSDRQKKGRLTTRRQTNDKMKSNRIANRKRSNEKRVSNRFPISEHTDSIHVDDEIEREAFGDKSSLFDEEVRNDNVSSNETHSDLSPEKLLDDDNLIATDNYIDDALVGGDTLIDNNNYKDDASTAGVNFFDSNNYTDDKSIDDSTLVDSNNYIDDVSTDGVNFFDSNNYIDDKSMDDYSLLDSNNNIDDVSTDVANFFDSNNYTDGKSMDDYSLLDGNTSIDDASTDSTNTDDDNIERFIKDVRDRKLDDTIEDRPRRPIRSRKAKTEAEAKAETEGKARKKVGLKSGAKAGTKGPSISNKGAEEKKKRPKATDEKDVRIEFKSGRKNKTKKANEKSGWTRLGRRLDKPDKQPQKRTGFAASGKWRSSTAKKRDDDKIKSEKKSQVIQILLGAAMYVVAVLGEFANELEPTTNLILYAIPGVILIIPVLVTIVKHIGRRRLLDENLLILIAVAGAFYHGMHVESVGVLLIFQFGKMIERLVLINTKKSIADNIDIKPEKANLKKGSQIVVVDPKELVPKQRIIIRPGEMIPVDAVVTEGRSMVDTKALTGESEPTEVKIGSKIFGGCVNLSERIEARVTKTYKESTVAKILELVAKVEEKKPKYQLSTEGFMLLYTPLIIIASALVYLLPPLLISTENPEVWMLRALIFLVAACPGGLLASIPTAYLGGISAALKQGILIKGAAFLEQLSRAEAFLFDKTGTLTEGVFRIRGIYPRNISKETLLSIAAHGEAFSMHPIAVSIKRSYGNKKIDESRVKNVREITGFGVECTIDGNDIIIGNARHLNSYGIFCHQVKRIGTAVHVAVNGKYAGYILLSDQIRADVPGLIKWLRQQKREIVIMSGDNERIVEDVRRQLSIEVGFANLLPEDKLDYLSAFIDSRMENEAVVFVGDGLNDALVLAQADVGIAMGGMGADAALEAADIVLLEDEPSKIINAVKIANNTRKAIRWNMFFAVFMKILMLTLAVAGLITMRQAVLADLGVLLILVLNSYWVSKQYVYVDVWPDEEEAT